MYLSRSDEQIAATLLPDVIYVGHTMQVGLPGRHFAQHVLINIPSHHAALLPIQV
jgi:hypothetical protein